MARAVMTYDKDLPEISGQAASQTTHGLPQKKAGTADEYEIVEGRRPSQMLLANRLRKAVDHWRSEGYPGSSSVAQRLFTYWFDEDHLIGGEAWVTVQKAKHVEINWIIETKGRVWDGTTAKDAAITDWCKKISAQTRTPGVTNGLIK